MSRKETHEGRAPEERTAGPTAQRRGLSHSDGTGPCTLAPPEGEPSSHSTADLRFLQPGRRRNGGIAVDDLDITHVDQ